MEFDEDKIDEAALAMLHLTSFREKGGPTRAWKGLDWDALDRLFEKGLIADPKGKAKSVWFSEEGAKAAEEAFIRLFSKNDKSLRS